MERKVSVFEYMNISLFLQDYYQLQKSLNQKFSYENWSQALGFSNKTLLRMIVQGKRQITENSKIKFQQVIKFNPLEKEYFDVLVDYSQAKSAKQRQVIGSRLIQIQRQTFIQAQFSATSELVKSAYGPIILTIISSVTEPISAAHIAELLKLETTQVSAVLNELEMAKAIIKTSTGYMAEQTSFKIPDLFGHQNLKTFYKFWIEQSAKAMDLPPEIRRYRSLQIPLSKDEFEEVVHKVNDFAMTLLCQFEKNTMHERKMYLINTALFPV